MLAKRWSLLSAFAGGCLSSLGVVAVLVTDGAESKRAAVGSDDDARSFSPVAFSPMNDELSDEAGPGETVEPEVARGGTDESAAVDDGSGEESGRSLADVLAHLETNYRQGLTADGAAPAVPPPPAAPDPVAQAVTTPQPAPPAAAPQAAATLAAAPPPAVAPSPASAPPSPAVAPKPDVSIAMRDVHVGDLHQDTYVANVRQGDTVVVQQIPVVQYVPVFALPPHTVGAPPASTARRGLTRRPPPFATSLTNPDNPWGFDFPPTVVVK